MTISVLTTFDKRKYDGTGAALGHDSAGRSLADDLYDLVAKANEVVVAVNTLPLAGVALAAVTELTIASGAVTITGAHHKLLPQSGSTDDLDTITGGAAGNILFLYPSDDTKDIVLKHATGNIETHNGRDVTLAENDDYAMLIRGATKWAVVGVKQKAGADAETDKQLVIPLAAGVADGGTWTKAITSGGLETVTRTAADAPTSFWADIPIPTKRTAAKGIKPTGLLVNYTVATADVADVRFEVWKVTQGADNAARTAAVVFGEDNADYDAAHNTAVERGDDTAAPELHLATITDAGTPAFIGAGETLKLRCYVDGDAGAAGTVVVTSAVLLYTDKD